MGNGQLEMVNESRQVGTSLHSASLSRRQDGAARRVEEVELEERVGLEGEDGHQNSVRTRFLTQNRIDLKGGACMLSCAYKED
jgi:hypothetical protein